LLDSVELTLKRINVLSVSGARKYSLVVGGSPQKKIQSGQQ